MEVMKYPAYFYAERKQGFTIKEGYGLGNNISSKVLAFAFSLSAEIECILIPQRTKEAMAWMKSEGLPVGRPSSAISKQTKLTGNDDMISELLSKKVGVDTIGKILGLNRLTVENYIKSRKLRESC